MRLTVLLFIFLTLNSCITINENGYRGVSKSYKSKLVPFDIATADAPYDQKQSLRLTEVTAAEMKPYLKKNAYTWIYMWIPYCRAESCMPMSYYTKIAIQSADKGLKLMMLSQIYDSSIIARQVVRSGFKGNIYVAKDAVYGHKMRKNRLGFTKDLSGHDNLMDPQLLFKGDSLVWSGEFMTAAKMDSLINAFQ
ncbi:hypothetical protein ACTHGU_17145 [Chitinophagaceae bacterium MMS25-I14]